MLLLLHRRRSRPAAALVADGEPSAEGDHDREGENGSDSDLWERRCHGVVAVSFP